VLEPAFSVLLCDSIECSPYGFEERLFSALALAFLKELGWPGSLLYVSGVAWLLYNALRGRGSKPDFFAEISGVIAVAMRDAGGARLRKHTGRRAGNDILWSFLSLSSIARRYNQYSIAICSVVDPYSTRRGRTLSLRTCTSIHVSISA
jgi:hypothetical protein